MAKINESMAKMKKLVAKIGRALCGQNSKSVQKSIDFSRPRGQNTCVAKIEMYFGRAWPKSFNFGRAAGISVAKMVDFGRRGQNGRGQNHFCL